MTCRNLTAQRLREVLDYCPDTGVFRWLVARGSRSKVGRIAGSVRSDKYRTAWIDGAPYLEHRLAWLYVYGTWPTKMLDHIDRDPANNRITNLREATSTENQHNRIRPRSDNSSGFLGCRQTKNGRWSAQIRAHGVIHHLGMFATAEEAHTAHIEAKKRFHPPAGL